LKRLGYRVLRFSNDRVLLDTKAVLRSILRHLSTPKSRHSPLTPPHL
jgi:very-short-patch-repair endonuclease